MILPGSYVFSLLILSLSLLCWGSWANSYKLTGGKWRFELYYIDFALGALLVSVVNDAFTVLASSQGAGVQSTSNTQGTTKDAAGIALENSINIPPTLYKNQGDKINIIVARDLDFSTVYGLRLSKDSGNGG